MSKLFTSSVPTTVQIGPDEFIDQVAPPSVDYSVEYRADINSWQIPLTTSRTDVEGGVSAIEFSSRSSPDWVVLNNAEQILSSSWNMFFQNDVDTGTRTDKINVPDDAVWSKALDRTRSTGTGAAFRFGSNTLSVSVGGSGYLVGDELVFSSSSQEFKLSVTNVTGGGSIVSSPLGVSLKCRALIPWTMSPLQLSSSSAQVHKDGPHPNGKLYILTTFGYCTEFDLIRTIDSVGNVTALTYSVYNPLFEIMTDFVEDRGSNETQLLVRFATWLSVGWDGSIGVYNRDSGHNMGSTLVPSYTEGASGTGDFFVDMSNSGLLTPFVGSWVSATGLLSEGSGARFTYPNDGSGAMTVATKGAGYRVGDSYVRRIDFDSSAATAFNEYKFVVRSIDDGTQSQSVHEVPNQDLMFRNKLYHATAGTLKDIGAISISGDVGSVMHQCISKLLHNTNAVTDDVLVSMDKVREWMNKVPSCSTGFIDLSDENRMLLRNQTGAYAAVPSNFKDNTFTCVQLEDILKQVRTAQRYVDSSSGTGNSMVRFDVGEGFAIDVDLLGVGTTNKLHLRIKILQTADLSL